MNMNAIVTLLLMLALVSFSISLWQYASPYWNRFVALGLTAATLAWLIGRNL